MTDRHLHADDTTVDSAGRVIWPSITFVCSFDGKNDVAACRPADQPCINVWTPHDATYSTPPTFLIVRQHNIGVRLPLFL